MKALKLIGPRRGDALAQARRQAVHGVNVRMP